MQDQILADLVIHDRMVFILDQRQADRLTTCLGLGLLLILRIGVDCPFDLQAERRQSEVIGSGEGERERCDRRDVGTDADGTQSDARLPVLQQADREERGAGIQIRSWRT